MTAKTTNCLFPRCKGKVSSRGLCLAHYTYAGALVRKRLTTWETLENNKKSLPKTKGRKGVKAWFLSPKKP